jgi:hypothetical protein
VSKTIIRRPVEESGSHMTLRWRRESAANSSLKALQIPC